MPVQETSLSLPSFASSAVTSSALALVLLFTLLAALTFMMTRRVACTPRSNAQDVEAWAAPSEKAPPGADSPSAPLMRRVPAPGGELGMCATTDALMHDLNSAVRDMQASWARRASASTPSPAPSCEDENGGVRWRAGEYYVLRGHDKYIDLFDHEAKAWTRVDLKMALDACCRFDDDGELWFPPDFAAEDPFLQTDGTPVVTFGGLCTYRTISLETMLALRAHQHDIHGLKFTKRALELMVENNFTFPFDFILFRPHMERTKGGDLTFNTIDSLYPVCLRSTYVAMVPAGTAPTSGTLCFGATTEWPGATFYNHVWNKIPAAQETLTCTRGDYGAPL